jgi:hypothetical protein
MDELNYAYNEEEEDGNNYRDYDGRQDDYGDYNDHQTM